MVITSIVLENTGGIAQSNVPQSFGQVFAKGDLPAGSAVELIAPNGDRIPCQIDVKTTHSDGSIRHALLSAIFLSLAPSASVTYGIAIATAVPTGSPPAPIDFPNLSASVSITDYGTDAVRPANGTDYIADLAPLLSAGKYTSWRSGPICAEWIVRAPLLAAGGVEHPTMHARFHVLVFKGQQRARIHCIVENSYIKPKVVPSNSTPWESASNGPRIYTYTITIGGVVAATRALSGYHRARLTGAIDGAYNAQTTRMPNDGRLFTATVKFNGVTKNLSIAGSAMQNYQQMFSAINAQISGAGTCDSGETSQELRFRAPGTGAASSVEIVDYGTLFPALTGTGLARNTTVYTATVTVGGTAYPISVAGNQAQTFSQLCSVIEAQTNGAVTCMPQLAAPGLTFTSTATGLSSDVTLTEGSLFAIAKTKLFSPYRPFRGDEVLQFPYTRWMRTFWWGTEPAAHLRHDKAYLISTNAVPNYDPAVTGSSATITSVLNDLNNYSDIGQSGITKGNMPGPGASPGIGILPRWQAMYFVNQGKAAKDTMLRQAALMGSWSVIHREYDTDRPISITKWPYATLSPNNADSRNPATGFNEKIPAPFGHLHLPNNPNTADVAHHPDFNFLPYMVTGDFCYLEGLQFYFTFTCLNMNSHASYRDGSKCLLKGESQTRGKAWFIRTAAHTAYLSPDGSGKKQEAEYVLAQNAQWLNNEYVKPGAPQNSMFGLLGELIYTWGGQSNVAKASFQEDFATQAAGRAVELGHTEFLPMLQYKSRHIKGRLTSGADFCWQLAAKFELQFRPTRGSPLYTSWKEVYQASAPANVLAAQCGSVEMAQAIGTQQNAFGGYPDSPEGYPANMQPAVAYCATYDMPSGDDAWTVFDGSTVKPRFNDGPQFAIIPRQLEAEPFRVQLFRTGAAGLGGAVSNTVSDTTFFDPVQPDESAQGSIEYRCDRVCNLDATRTLYDAVLWLSANTPSVGTTIKVGVGASGVNGVETEIVSEKVAPLGVTFSLAGSREAGAKLGDLPPGGWRHVWYERTVLSSTQAVNVDSFTRTVDGFIE